MSDALKRLEEIEQQAKYLRAEFVPLITCRKAADSVELLARLVRSVAEAECGLFLGAHLTKYIPLDGRVRCPERAALGDTPGQTLVWCWPCRIRKELSRG